MNPVSGTVPDDPASGGARATEALSPTLYDVVRDLQRDAAAVELPLAVEGRDEADASRRRLLDQLDQHLVPRLRELGAPAVVVVAGSTGAGKSTLYNSLLGAEESPAGVLRPTTREPVYAHHPADTELVPDSPTVRASRVVVSDAVPRGIALLDAPDLDSLDDANRKVAAELLEGADLWLFVTTAARYGDALPWSTLRLAAERGASIAMVLNRVPRENLLTVRGDLLERLREHGLENTPLFVVPDVGPHEGMLDEAAVAPVRRWLTLLAGEERSRSVVLRTLQGSLDALPPWISRTAEAVEAQVAAGADARAAVERAAQEVEHEARRSVRGGAVATGAVAAGWAQVAHARVDGVKVKDGRARATRRSGRARERALAPVGEAADRSVRRTFEAWASTADTALRAALAPVPGGPGVAPDVDDAARLERRDAIAAMHADTWRASARARAARWQGERADAAAKAFGAGGLADLLTLGGAGLDDATRALVRVLGDEVTDDVAALAVELDDHAAGVVRDTVADTLAVLDVPALRGDASSGLRLRRAELVRLAARARALTRTHGTATTTAGGEA